MTKQTLVNRGDWIEAVHDLEADDVEKPIIAELLGFEWRETKLSEQVPDELAPARQKPQEETRLQDPSADSRLPPLGESENEAWANAIEGDVLEAAEISSAVPLPRSTPSYQIPQPPLDPLFHPEWTRAVLTSLLTIERKTRNLDLDALIEILALNRPIPTRLPRAVERVIPPRVALLLDRGVSMQPFSGDQHQLLRWVRSLVPSESLEVAYFASHPRYGITRSGTDERVPYTVPTEETLVLVVSDLGAGPPGAGPVVPPALWMEYALAHLDTNCWVATLCPGDLGRLPDALRKTMLVLPWSRDVNIGQLRPFKRRWRERVDQ